MFQPDLFLQKCLHLNGIESARRLQFLLHLFQPAAQVNAPKRPDGPFDPLHRQLLGVFQENRREAAAIGLPFVSMARARATLPGLLDSSPLEARSQAYDLVLNGWELGSGSVRIHRPDVQQRIFSLLGIDPEEAQDRFGFLLDAFRFGAPPHAGFAIGMDRFVALLAGEENIREVIAFPKTQSGVDPLTNAPLPVDDRLLRDLGLKVSVRPGLGLAAAALSSEASSEDTTAL